MIGYIRPTTKLRFINKCTFCGKEYKERQGTFEFNGNQITPPFNLKACPECAKWYAVLKVSKVAHNLIRLGDSCWIKERSEEVTPNSIYYISYKDSRGHIFNPSMRLGVIPKKLKPFYCETGIMIDKEVYQSINKTGMKISSCNLKGCYDRYTCFWYNMENEKDGAWNIIPDDFNSGDEGCPSYINSKIMNKYK